MTSTITNYSTSINVVFPVQGQDNDTQGFRDNSLATRNAFSVAASEITDLQNTQASLTNIVTILSTVTATTSTLGLVMVGSNLDISGEGVLSVSPVLNLPRTTTLTISDESVTIDSGQSSYAIQTSSSSTDYLRTILGGIDGQVILLRSAANTQTIRVLTSGNITGLNKLILKSYQYVPFYRDNDQWYPVLNNTSDGYYPNITPLNNVYSATNIISNYNIAGDMVEVWGSTSIATVDTGSTTYEISLPFDTNFTNAYSLSGTDLFNDQTNYKTGLISSNPTSDAASVNFYSGSTATTTHYYQFKYRIGA